MRRCGKCGEVKPERAFNRAGKGRQHWCRECFRAYFKARGALHLAQVKESRTRRRADRRAVIDEHLIKNPCADCGERDLVVLDFDHRDASLKTADVSDLWLASRPIETILAEIAQCDVVCANCHRRRTATRAGWRRILKEAVGTSNHPRKDRNIRWVYSYLREHPCVDCGETDSLLLEFDHVGTKRANVTALAWGEYSIATIQREIAQCEVRCCNCHRRRTAERRLKPDSGQVPSRVEPP